jgi:hypothetical protein
MFYKNIVLRKCVKCLFHVQHNTDKMEKKEKMFYGIVPSSDTNPSAKEDDELLRMPLKTVECHCTTRMMLQQVNYWHVGCGCRAGACKRHCLLHIPQHSTESSHASWTVDERIRFRLPEDCCVAVGETTGLFESSLSVSSVFVLFTWISIIVYTCWAKSVWVRKGIWLSISSKFAVASATWSWTR